MLPSKICYPNQQSRRWPRLLLIPQAQLQPVINSCGLVLYLSQEYPLLSTTSTGLYYDPNMSHLQFYSSHQVFPPIVSSLYVHLLHQGSYLPNMKNVIMICSWLKFISSSLLPSHSDSDYFSSFPFPSSFLFSPSLHTRPLTVPWSYHHVLLEPTLEPALPA